MLKHCANVAVIGLAPNASVSEAAGLMKTKNIGSVVILDEGWPVGILTDRDIVLRVVAVGLDPEATAVRQVMSKEPLMLDEHLDMPSALDALDKKGVRRALVVDEDMKLVGFFSLDDVLCGLGHQMNAVASIIKKEIQVHS